MISDTEGNRIEQVTDSVFFFTTAGGFIEIEITVPTEPEDKRIINEKNVPFTFRMKPENSFSSSAAIKITLPAQLFVEDPVVSIGYTLQTMNSVPSTQTDLRFNRIITI